MSYPDLVVEAGAINPFLLRATPAIGGVLAGTPWWVLVAVVVTYLIFDFAWRVLQRPDLAHRWLDVRDRYRERRRP